MTTAIVVVSHSAQLARGVCELAVQMAPDVMLLAAGGTEDGRLGTSFDLVSEAVRQTLAEAGGVVVLTDLGSATLTTETVLEILDDARVVMADGPLVEGAVAAAVAAQGGAGVDAVRAAAEAAALSFAAVQGDDPAGHDGEVLERVLALDHELGLHARPAAMLARLVAGFDARVEINGVDGASVLALIGLEARDGDLLTVRASGPQAEHVLDAVAQMVDDRFGEA
ncbi:MAG TPA: dihydroxyacetone kinase phosphoryl donor subunit DhaM [Actinomycetaceae bacterium]|nr:dihydroxyacetone kinase phosphoryl donor subunit DhaM [Actinomycetaceae bacterium]